MKTNTTGRSALLALLAAGLGASACAPASSDEAASEGSADITAASSPKFIERKGSRPDEFIVVLASSQLAQTRIPSLAARYNAQVFQTYETVLSGFAARMTEADARQLAQDPAVKYVQRNGQKHTSEVQPNATWGIDRVDQVSLPLDKQYAYTLTGRGVNAVVIDTGVDRAHPAFGGRVAAGFNALSTGAVDDVTDNNGHGTHVAGTIASNTWGLAKQATIIPVRVCDASGNCNDADIVKAVDWVTKNVAKPAVVNMSLGGPVDGTTDVLEAAMRASIASGITYVVAAGNDSADACSYSPSRIAETITTGATSSNDRRSYFSNYGTCVDVFAPGSSITSARRNSTGSTSMSGTSMASPHVAGAVALFLEGTPAATPAEMADIVRRNATPDKVGSPGSGSPNFLLHVGDPIAQ